MGAALRMAKLYYERYPFILEWSNVQGKTALHAAALKGNEDLAQVRASIYAQFPIVLDIFLSTLDATRHWGRLRSTR